MPGDDPSAESLLIASRALPRRPILPQWAASSFPSCCRAVVDPEPYRARVVFASDQDRAIRTEPPAPSRSLPPPPWQQHIDATRNSTYWYNPLTGETSWLPPAPARTTRPAGQESEYGNWALVAQPAAGAPPVGSVLRAPRDWLPWEAILDTQADTPAPAGASKQPAIPSGQQPASGPAAEWAAAAARQGSSKEDTIAVGASIVQLCATECEPPVLLRALLSGFRLESNERFSSRQAYVMGVSLEAAVGQLGRLWRVSQLEGYTRGLVEWICR